MRLRNVCKGWVRHVGVLVASLVFLSACSSSSPAPVTVATTVPPAAANDDFSDLIATLSADLHRSSARTGAAKPKVAAAAPAESKRQRDRAFADRAKALFAPLNGTALQMPVVGITPGHLSDSWGNPRDGGRRSHKGIDIFAPKGTPVVAVQDGVITYIGEQSKGGLCLWLSTESGASFYYAHLDRWASGLYEGMEVRSGDLLGYVGNTGNARTTPPHLHFQVSENDRTVNPYPILTRASVVRRARVATESASALGTR